jgi:hypothetical protein
MTQVDPLDKQIFAANAELAVTRAEIQTLRMRLKNAELMYASAVAKLSAKKANSKRAERN